MTVTSVIQKVALCAGLAFSFFQASLVCASPSPANAYVVVEGKVSQAGTGDAVSYFYLDVYKIYPDSRRELSRTGRYTGDRFKAYLELGYGHTLEFKLDGKEQERVDISAMELHEAREQGIKINVLLESPASASPASTVPALAPTTAEEAPPAAVAVPEMPENRHLEKNEARPAPRQVVNAATPSTDKASLPLPEKEQAPPPLGEEKIKDFISAQLEAPLPVQERIRLSRQVFLYREIEERSKVLARLSAGSEVEVLERTTSKWWMVAHQGHIGWIETQVLQ